MKSIMKVKVTVSVDEGLLAGLDALVEGELYESRSSAMEAAIGSLRAQIREQEFERNLALLDPATEQAEAELGMVDYAALVSEAVQ
jgi:Arc/MetJ-type ribon-helix-helix transcriptional regulator